MIRLALVLGLASGGCVGARADDCQKLYEKMEGVLAREGGAAVPAADRARGLSECRDGLPSHKEDALIRCVADAGTDDAVRACITAHPAR